MRVEKSDFEDCLKFVDSILIPLQKDTASRWQFAKMAERIYDINRRRQIVRNLREDVQKVGVHRNHLISYRILIEDTLKLMLGREAVIPIHKI